MGTVQDKIKIGLNSELKAISWLVDQGYEVFRNIAFHGPVDLVVYKDSKVTLVDVKTLILDKRPDGDFLFSWKAYLTPKQIEMGVRPLFVYGDTVGWNRDYFSTPNPKEG